MRRSHDALSVALTSLAVRAGGPGPQQASCAPLEVWSDWPIKVKTFKGTWHKPA